MGVLGISEASRVVGFQKHGPKLVKLVQMIRHRKSLSGNSMGLQGDSNTHMSSSMGRTVYL